MEERTRRVLIVAYNIMMGKEAISSHNVLKISMDDKTRGHKYKLCKRQIGTLQKRFLGVTVTNALSYVKQNIYVYVTHWQKQPSGVSLRQV